MANTLATYEDPGMDVVQKYQTIYQASNDEAHSNASNASLDHEP